MAVGVAEVESATDHTPLIGDEQLAVHAVVRMSGRSPANQRDPRRFQLTRHLVVVGSPGKSAIHHDPHVDSCRVPRDQLLGVRESGTIVVKGPGHDPQALPCLADQPLAFGKGIRTVDQHTHLIAPGKRHVGQTFHLGQKAAVAEPTRRSLPARREPVGPHGRTELVGQGVPVRVREGRWIAAASPHRQLGVDHPGNLLDQVLLGLRPRDSAGARRRGRGTGQFQDLGQHGTHQICAGSGRRPNRETATGL